MKTLLINPNIIAVENIDEPPRLKSGKAIPVNGIKPRIVNKFINICAPRRINKPESKYFSNSIWVSFIILFSGTYGVGTILLGRKEIDDLN